MICINFSIYWVSHLTYSHGYQISEAMDIRTREGLLNAMVGKVGKRMDTLLVPLELLCCISRTQFSDKKAYIKWQKRQVRYLFFHVYVLVYTHLTVLLFLPLFAFWFPFSFSAVGNDMLEIMSAILKC